MSKKNWAKTWINQGALGREFGLSAIAVGRKLEELGLRQDRQPTQAALDSGLAHAAPLANGTPNFRWHKRKAIAALIAAGLTRRTADEVHAASVDAQARNTARDIARLEASPDGMDQKAASLMWDTVPAEQQERVAALMGERFHAHPTE